MAWIKKTDMTFFEVFCLKIFNVGRIPRHISFIMDGNRRYAKKNNFNTATGYVAGFDKLRQTLKWCFVLGVQEVTMYAFSIENFKRSKGEVDAVMELLREEILKVEADIGEFNTIGIRLHFAGRLSLLPRDMQEVMAKVMMITRDNNKMRFNLACSYTGRDEISRAASHIVDGVRNNELLVQDIDLELISQTLELGETELLIRTSSEVRLSDFMLWQVPNAVLYFSNALWPEFTIWNFLAALIHFQRHAPSSKQIEHTSNIKHKCFLDKLEMKRWKQLEEMSLSCPE